MGDASALGFGDATTMEQNLAVLAVGTAINSALYGLFSGQVAYYLRHSCHSDRPSLQCVVLAVSVLNTLHLVLYIYTAWVMFVPAHAALYLSIHAMPWSTYAQILLNSIAVLVIQTFYAHRIWKIGRSIAATTVLGLFILCTFAGGVVLFTYTLLAVEVTALYLELVHIEKAINITFAVTDIALTSSLLYVLIRSSKDGPSPLVKRIVFYTLSTGVFTCVSALAGIVLIFLFPNSIMSTIIWYLATSLYCTSLMASLNARENLRSKYSVSSRLSMSMSCTMPRFAPPSARESTSGLQNATMFERSTESYATEAPLNHSDIMIERRSVHSLSWWDPEKHAAMESIETSSLGDSVTSVAVAETGDVVESSREEKLAGHQLMG